MPGSEVITAGETPAGTNLQEVNPLQALGVLEERLFTDDPTGRDCGEGSPIVLVSELGRSIRTEQELEQITVGISVIDTSDIRQRTTLITSEYRCLLTIGRIRLTCCEWERILALAHQIF